jgi:predicted TIM-barrel fold metal-dependent hydrolase
MIDQRRLPLIVHAGYSLPPEWASPRHLLDVLTRHPDLRIDVSHSGWPDHGAAMILARERPNCYFNLCWTPLLSRALGRRMLSEAIDMLPLNKLLIGTDAGTPEAFVGAVRMTRRLLTEVLEEKVRQGQFDVEVAKRVAKAILLDNALEFYGIKPGQVVCPGTGNE